MQYRGKNARTFRKLPLCVAMLGCLYGASAMAQTAPAQNQTQQSDTDEDAKDLDKVTVTGSLLKRLEYDTTSPVQVITADTSVRDLPLALAREMLEIAGVGVDPEPVLDDGRAMEVFERLVAAQGGNLSEPLPTAAHTHVVESPTDGYLQRMDCKAVGVAVWRLGAGRARKEDDVSLGAGALVEAKVGDRLQAGQPLLVLHTDDLDRLDGALAALDGAIDVGDDPVEPRPLIADRIAR